jgi:hypothetical protein
MDKIFEDILNDCLERLLVRGETVEDCLNAYPKQAEALKPLLQTALLAKKVTMIEPRPEFKASARHQFRTALNEASPRQSNLFSTLRFRWATALVAILVMLMVSGGLVVAAGTSMPDNPLYSVKLAVEQMQLNLTFSDLGKANLYAEFADRRASEIMHMAQKGNANQVMETTNLLGKHLIMVANLATDTENIWHDNNIIDKNGQSVLESDELRTETPGSALQTPESGSTLPPALSTDVVFQDSLAEESETSELLNLLIQDEVKNSSALRDSLNTAAEPVQSALKEAIAVLEAGYFNAINAIVNN